MKKTTEQNKKPTRNHSSILQSTVPRKCAIFRNQCHLIRLDDASVTAKRLKSGVSKHAVAQNHVMLSKKKKKKKLNKIASNPRKACSHLICEDDTPKKLSPVQIKNGSRNIHRPTKIARCITSQETR
jgi:hypothetical protein